MFERFNSAAKHVVVGGQTVARSQRARQYEPEHVLAGLVHHPRCLGTTLLAALGIDADAVWRRATEGITELDSNGSTLPMSPRVKRSLIEAQRAATELGHAHVGTEHLLVGLASRHQRRLRAWLGAPMPDRQTVLGLVADTTAGLAYPADPADVDPAGPWATESTMFLWGSIEEHVKVGHLDLALDEAQRAVDIGLRWDDDIVTSAASMAARLRAATRREGGVSARDLDRDCGSIPAESRFGQGVLAARRGDGASAREHLADALASTVSSEQTEMIVLIDLELADLARADGASEVAAVHYRQALDTANAAGLTHHAEQAAAALRAIT